MDSQAIQTTGVPPIPVDILEGSQGTVVESSMVSDLRRRFRAEISSVSLGKPKGRTTDLDM